MENVSRQGLKNKFDGYRIFLSDFGVLVSWDLLVLRQRDIDPTMTQTPATMQAAFHHKEHEHERSQPSVHSPSVINLGDVDPGSTRTAAPNVTQLVQRTKGQQIQAPTSERRWYAASSAPEERKVQKLGRSDRISFGLPALPPPSGRMHTRPRARTNALCPRGQPAPHGPTARWIFPLLLAPAEGTTQRDHTASERELVPRCPPALFILRRHERAPLSTPTLLF
jgi:hypothetical protein